MHRYTPLLLLISILAGACQVRFDTVIEVNDDESGSFAIEIGMDQELRELSEQDGGAFDVSDPEGVPEGWTVEEFDDGEFAGSRIATTFESLAALKAKLQELAAASAQEGGTPNELIDTINLTRNGDTFDFEADLSEIDQEFTDLAAQGGELQGIDPAQLLETFFKVRFVVTLPGTIGASNADLIDGNTLIWNVPFDGQQRTLRATSTTGGRGLAGLLPIAAAVLLVVVLGGAGFVRYRGRAATTPVPESVMAAAPTPVEPPSSSRPVEGDPFSG